MKAILIPIHPEWISKIFNGEKSIEIRKSKALYKAAMELIQKQGFARFFIYCTKNGYGLIKLKEVGIKPFYPKEYDVEDGQHLPNLNGKVVAKFTVRKVDEIEVGTKFTKFENGYCTFYASVDEMTLLRKTCLFAPDILHYAGYYDDYTRPYKSKIYAYHIEDLVIFDKPKELSEFHKIGFSEWCAEHPPILSLLQPKKCYEELKQFMITKAPQSYCYVEVEK